MDKKTVDVYNERAEKFAELYNSIVPKRLYALARTHFPEGGSILDIGCGGGRDVNHFRSLGYMARGCDATMGMVEQAKKNFPEHSACFFHSELPGLENIEDEAYDNVYSSAVYMHVQEKDFLEAAINTLRVTKPGGHIILSFRPVRPEHQSDQDAQRESDERLFTAIDPDQFSKLFQSLGGQVLVQQTQKGADDDRVWTDCVIRKVNLPG